MKIFSCELLVLSLLIFCSSCAKIFAPNNHHQIVSPNKKGSLQLAGGFYDTYLKGEVKDYPAPLQRYSYGAQLGYSPIEGLGVIANFFRPNYILRSAFGNIDINGGVVGPNVRIDSDTTNAYFGYLADIAVGRYWKKTTNGSYLEKKNSVLFDHTNEWLFDVYVGGGKGHLSTNYSIVGNKEIDFNLYYIQGGVHWRNGKVGVDLVQRLIGTDFKEFHFIGNIFKDDLVLAENLSKKPFRLASRTALRLNAGPEYGKVYVEGNWTNYSDGLERFYFNDQRFSIGIILELDTCWKRLKK